MRILHVDTGKEWRGGQIQLTLLWEALQRTGVVQQSMLAVPGPLLEYAQRNGWPVMIAGLRSAWRAMHDCDVVHAHDARSHTLMALARMSSHRLPLVISRRVAFALSNSLISRWKYRQGDRYLAVSQCVARTLVGAGIPSHKIVVVYDAVPDAQAVWRWQADAPIVFLHSHDSGKCLELTRAVAKNMPGQAFVWSDNLRESFTKPCAAFCYLSQSEGLGSATLLAMSMGVPVVASRVGGMAEVFDHERSGLYVENREGEITRTLRRITTDRAFAEHLSVEGFARVRSTFSVKRMTELTLDAYRRVLL